MLVRTPGGRLAVLIFTATARGQRLRLDSQTWNGVTFDDMDDAIKALQETADAHLITENNRVTDTLLHTDPLDSHFFLMEPWDHKRFIEAIKRDGLFDCQRPVLTPVAR